VDAIGADGLLVVFFGLVQLTHEQVAFTKFLVDFVIQMTTHGFPLHVSFARRPG